jgi:hypothetical protein
MGWPAVWGGRLYGVAGCMGILLGRMPQKRTAPKKGWSVGAHTLRSSRSRRGRASGAQVKLPGPGPLRPASNGYILASYSGAEALRSARCRLSARGHCERPLTLQRATSAPVSPLRGAGMAHCISMVRTALAAPLPTTWCLILPPHTLRRIARRGTLIPFDPARARAGARTLTPHTLLRRSFPR